MMRRQSDTRKEQGSMEWPAEAYPAEQYFLLLNSVAKKSILCKKSGTARLQAMRQIKNLFFTGRRFFKCVPEPGEESEECNACGECVGHWLRQKDSKNFVSKEMRQNIDKWN